MIDPDERNRESAVLNFTVTNHQPLQQLLELQYMLITAAKQREAKAWELLKQAEQHLFKANEYWEQCCTDVRMLEPGD